MSEVLVFDLPGYEYAAQPPFLLSAMLLKFIKLALFSFYLTSESNGTVFLFFLSLGRGYCGLQVKHKLCFCFAFNQFLNGCCPEIVFSPEGTEVGWAFHTILTTSEATVRNYRLWTFIPGELPGQLLLF